MIAKHFEAGRGSDAWWKVRRGLVEVQDSLRMVVYGSGALFALAGVSIPTNKKGL
jgi:hypothetical protein